MPRHTNFLLGYGERLVEPVEHRSGPRDTTPPYNADMARARLSGFVSTTARELNSLPSIVCPNDQAVAVLTLHPQYIAKSHYPISLLHAAGFEAIGSKPTVVTPEKLSRERKPKPAPTTDLFVKVPRRQIMRLAEMLPTWRPAAQSAANDFTKVEKLRAMNVNDRLKKIVSRGKEVPLEVVVHAGPDRASAFILEGLEAYLNELDVKARYDKKFHVGGLCFLPVEAARDAIPKIAEFSFVRVVRELPRLRTVSPRIAPVRRSTPIVLPDDGPQNPDLRLAVFDGGLAPHSPLTKWATAHNPPGVGAPSPDHLIHGHHVTSALLFGSLKDGETPARPYAHVDHYRVLDVDSESDPFELYDVLERIKSVLETRRYEFINLSVGPALPIEDDDVHGWTSYFDEFLSGGTTLATIAVGNTGELDWDSGNARIQVPADCVNALAVGSANSVGRPWARSSYSSIGPGRRPGAMKPDVLAFGGSDDEPFIVIDPSNRARSISVVGTSFATPNSLRVGAGIRTHLGNTIWPLSIRALLIHCAECPSDNHIEHGWGRIPHEIEDVLLCPDDTVRVLYQGELSPAEYRRAKIPVPVQTMAGMVSIKATFCYTCPVDPQDPGNYTRSGLDIVFRPDKDDLDDDALNPRSDSFFQIRKFSTERELRHDALKWETTLHREKSKRGSSLNNPVFDIHYNARAEGHGAGADAKPMRYALVVTVQSKRTADLYNQIVRRYRAQLEPLRPVVQIPLRAA